MRRKVIQIMAWIQIAVSVVLIAVSPVWLQVNMEPGERLFLAVAYLVFGVAFLIDAVRDLERYRTEANRYEGPTQSDDACEKYFSVDLNGKSMEVFCNAEIIPAAGGVGRQYICFPDELRLIVEEGRYTGWYFAGDEEGKGGEKIEEEK